MSVRMEMPYEAEWIIKKIRERGFEAFAVGGCVRDTLLGRTPEDWDITTSAKPEEVKAIFGKTVDTGLQHGTVTIIKNHKGYEVTTYRIDGEYHDGRHPDSVEFTSNLKEDLKRRDFTINAMAYSHETGIVDEFNGMEDLRNGVVRCVGLAHDRFTEDALRILRAIRFAAQLDFQIEEETYCAIERIAPNLSKVSKERIQTELTKLLLSDHPEKIVMVEETGISPYAADGLSDVFKAWGNENRADLAGLKTLPGEKAVRWAGFLRVLEPEQAAGILKGLKSDNETIDNVKAMIAVFQGPLNADKTEIRRVLRKRTPYQLDGALRLKAWNGSEEFEKVKKIRELWKEILTDGDCVSLKNLAVNGRDLIQAGFQPGKEIGKILDALLDLVLEDPKLNRKEILLKKIKSGSTQMDSKNAGKMRS